MNYLSWASPKPPLCFHLGPTPSFPLNRTQAYIYYSQSNISPYPATYSLNGVSKAKVVIEPANHRFKISNITNPQAFNAQIKISYAGQPSLE